MFDENLPGMLSLEFADPARVPELTGDTEILAATHESIGSTPLCSRGNTIRREVILFTASNGNKPMRN